LTEIFINFIPPPSPASNQNAFLPLTSHSLFSPREKEALHFLQVTRIGIIPKGQQKLVVFDTTSDMLCTEDTPFINRHFSMVRKNLITWAANVQNRGQYGL
jgi:hypothetical protein